MISQQTIDNNVSQGIAGYIQYLNDLRLADLAANLKKILTTESDNLANLASRQAKALANIDWANLEITNVIDSNRGGGRGVHGFIAEFAETGITNARRAFKGLQRSTQVLNDNGPADLLVHGRKVQVKFYNNVLEELKTSSNYQSMKMMFPKDHMELFQKIMNGETSIEYKGGRLTLKQIENIKKLINKESTLRGESWTKWTKSSAVDYNAVQKGAINRTLSDEVDGINMQTNSKQQEISRQADNERTIAHQKSQPSLGEASKTAGVGAAVQGGINLGLFIYKKHKEGKEVWEFQKEDWIEAGVKTAKGTAQGAVTGYAIYGLTNVCHLAAPSAGAITSGTFGLANAIIKFRIGEVDDDGFVELVTANAIDATGTAIGAAIGQAFIPIPVVGALVGSIVATATLGLGKGMLNKRKIELISSFQNRVDNFIETLDAVYKAKIDELLGKYSRLGELQKYAFDFSVNVQLQFISSIDLATFVRVDEGKILHDESEIDNFFLN